MSTCLTRPRCFDCTKESKDLFCLKTGPSYSVCLCFCALSWPEIKFVDTTQKGPAYYILWLLGGVLKTVPVFFLEKVRLVFVAPRAGHFGVATLLFVICEAH